MAGKYSSWISGFLIGGAIGVGVALLSAPQSGEMTRFMIREKGKQVADQMRTTVDDTRSQAQQVIGDVSSKVSDTTQRLKSVSQEVLDDQKRIVNEGVQKAKRVMSDGQDMMEQERDAMNKAADKTQDAFNG